MVHLENMKVRGQVRAGVIGHAIGDALGVPVEFAGRKELAINPVCDMIGYGTHHMPAGTWSDDTSMEIALMQSLIDCSEFDYEDIMKKFQSWWRDGDFTTDGRAFDIGGACARAVRNFNAGVAPLKCGENDKRCNGNGSLMRILPIAYVCNKSKITENERYDLVRKVSSLTHAHEISVLGCLIYVNFICHIMNGEDQISAYLMTQKENYSMFSDLALTEYGRILTERIDELPEGRISSRGYVVDTLEAALWCFLTTSDYKTAVLRAVNLGGDTDTIGAVTGSMAGIYYGYDAIPRDWISKLQRINYLLEICDNFAAKI